MTATHSQPETTDGRSPVSAVGVRPVVPNSIAFVAPRFGPGVVGGAEAVMADAAFGLARRGYSVEILTTCARDHFTWANEFPAGVTEHEVDGGSVVVRRFLVENDTPGTLRDAIGNQILAGAKIPIQDQQRWMNDSLRSSTMWDHVFDHGDRYRALIFAPYMFWTTFAVSRIRPERSIIMPCLHDEPPAYLELFSSMIAGVHGIWFLTDPERDLAERLYDLPNRTAVVGASVDLPEAYEPEEFRKLIGFDGPFFYYAGRREWGKGWDDLLAAYSRYLSNRLSRRGVARPPLPLVTSGVGEVQAPPGLERFIIDVGLLDDAQRDNAMAAAAAYVQPSAMESFSRTVLEAMATSTPVIGNGAGAVVAWHIENSGAGLTYRGEGELVQCLDFITDEPATARSLADTGPAYVRDRYLLDGVLDRMVGSLESWLPAISRFGLVSNTPETVAEGVRRAEPEASDSSDRPSGSGEHQRRSTDAGPDPRGPEPRLALVEPEMSTAASKPAHPASPQHGGESQ